MASCMRLILVLLTIHQVVALNDEICVEGQNLDANSRVCIVQDKELVYDKALEWVKTDIHQVRFINTQITCHTSAQTACSVDLALMNTNTYTEMSFEQGSTVRAQGVYIRIPNGKLSIDATSTLEASGRSLHSRGSSHAGESGQGASYIGQGGSCSSVQEDKTYGTFDMKPNPTAFMDSVQVTQVGSAGIGYPTVDRATAGGGRIYINVDSLNFQCDKDGIPQLQADGFPLMSTPETAGRDLHGGTGGYIYINSLSKVSRNSFKGLCQVSAQGGYGKGVGYGGSGGVVVLDGKTTSMGMVHINGGRAGSKFQHIKYKGCGNAASGTYYTSAYDALIVDNMMESDKATVLWANKESSQYPGEFMVTQDLWIGPLTNVHIKKNSEPEILFPTLYMAEQSLMYFDISWAGQMLIKYRDSFDVHATSLIDFTRISDLTSFKSISALGTASNIKLGQIKFSGNLYIEASTLELRNDTFDPSPTVNRNSFIQMITNNIMIGRDAKITAGHIFMFANDTIVVDSGAEIKSTVDYQCQLHDARYELFQCFTDEEKDQDMLDFQYVIDFHNEQYGLQSGDEHFARHAKDLYHFVMRKWNVYMLSLGTVGIQDSDVIAPRIGICANGVEIEDSQIDASGRGCRHDSGLGRGRVSEDCAAPGGSHGGQGGYGATQVLSQNKIYAANCEDHSPKPYYFGHEARYEGSGGGSGDSQMTSGGSGGGVIWLTSVQDMMIRTRHDNMNNDRSKKTVIAANGMDGEAPERDQVGSGGGAGGSIQIMALNLEGQGASIEVRGGDGSEPGGGGGSGGRLIVHLLRSYREDSQPRQSGGWNGTYNIHGGNAGSMPAKFKQGSSGHDGSIYSTKCMPGYSGPFCMQCLPGTFKPDYSYGVCEKCQNKPANSFYNQAGDTSAICSYECTASSLIERVETNPDCLDPISLEMQRVGGLKSFFGLLLAFLFFSYLIYFTTQCRTVEVLKQKKALKDTIYAAWDDKAPQTHRGRIAEHFYPLNDQTIWCHTHRMYLVGQNTPNFPWQIPKDFPRDALAKEHREKLCQFIDEHNSLLRYSNQEKWLISLLNLLYPPIAQYISHQFFRKRKFRNLQRALFRYFPPQFWTDRGENKSLRLGWSKYDHNLAFIDFIDFERNRENWLGVKLNMPILLAGSGTYHHPYFLDYRDDVLAKSLVLVKYSFFYDKLSIFFENFNSQLNKISFYKLDQQVMRDLTKSVFWLETANKTMFQHFGFKGVLYIIENSYTETDPGVFRQKRRSFPLETCFFDAFPEMFLEVINYVRQKLISGKSEIRMAIVFKRYVKTKEIKKKLRVGKMIQDQTSEKKAFAQAIEKQESVLFDVEDNQKEDDRLTYANRSKAANQYLPNASSSESIHDPSTNIRDELETKMVDTSLQAFSITIQSSKMFEIAIRKPRNKPKHLITKIRASLYSVYLMLVKNHGSQPKDKDLNNWQLLYSVLLAIDFMILFHYTLHIFIPFENFQKFGWCFLFVYWLVPYFSPIFALLGAIYTDEGMLRIMGHMNSICITVNIPIVFLVSIYNDEDPAYFLILVLMVCTKILVNIVSSRVRQYIINPRYESNKSKLTKILQRQRTKLRKREEILGKDLSNQAYSGLPIDFRQPSVLQQKEAKKYLTQLHEEEQNLEDQEKLRDKLLED